MYYNTKKEKQPFKPTILQYNSFIPLHTLAIQSVYCNTMAQQPTSLLQYNFNPLHHHIAIQFSSHMHSLAIQFSSCNTNQANYTLILQYNSNTNFFFLAFSLAIQLQGCNTIFFFTIQLGSSPNTFLLHFLSSFFFFSFKLLENHPKIHIYIFFLFFFTHAIGKIPKNISIHICFFISSNYWKNKKNIHLFFFFFVIILK